MTDRDPDLPRGDYHAAWLPRVREPAKFPDLQACKVARKRGGKANALRNRIERMLKED